MKLTFDIAKTHLFSRPKQTLVAMMGVTFGIGMFIAMVSLMTGLNDMTESLAMTSSPDIRIYHDITQDRTSIVEELNPRGINFVHHPKPKNETQKVRNAFKIAEIIRRDPTVRGVSPQLTSQVFYNYGPVQLGGTIAGVDIIEEDRLFGLKAKMKAGRIENLIQDPNGIIMGTGLARKLKAQTGDRVVITTPQGFTTTLKIVGLFQMGIGAIDNIKSYASISTVQHILQKEKAYITDINIKLHDFHLAKELAPQYQKQFRYKAEDWEVANATMLLGVIIRNILTYSVSITLLIVAGFGIYNILNMTIINKMKDIAILKAMGFSGGDVKQIFVIQSLAIGLAGSVLGLVIGFGLSSLIAQAPFNGGDILSIEHLPVNFKLKYYLIGIVFGVTTTALAGYMPSRKASHVDPIEILRG
ncbi:ABC transporter permease [Pseudochryseolinea flava]|uniref:ABC transporter permease n=1 Tax=Pseudochryseolinea flava TaxID=2059302 RepID=A0A364XWH0_9BACT|nr:FtsX-like permease family protein [Pseudochryseolinea flava]RAV97743.1 ABC transporter permease [Pseudochryseolinea flava]